MSGMSLDLTPQLVTLLVNVEKLVGKKSSADLICEALRFYEDILKRALEGKVRLSSLAETPPCEAPDPPDASEMATALETRMSVAAKAGLMPKI